MNRIILIGNGFDIANGLETSYSDFIIWLWKKFNSEYNNHIKVSNSEYKIDGFVTYQPYSNAEEIIPIESTPNNETFINATKTSEICKISFENDFFKIITINFNKKNWVDIEAEYFNLLIKSIDGGGTNRLNKEFGIIKNELKEYLKFELENKKSIKLNAQNITEYFFLTDFSTQGYDVLENEYYFGKKDEFLEIKRSLNYFENKDKESYNLQIPPKNIVFLNFNYTDLSSRIIERITRNGIQYEEWAKIPMYNINIHGELNNTQNPMIFGYGDEEDENHKKIEKRGDEFLSNIKTINYLKTGNYKMLQSFIESGFYQIYLFGHSCGLSDKTLLNTLFEHKNCVSIKPFYYEWEDEKRIKHDNYDDIIKNIYRIFSNKTSMRDKVVSRIFCKQLAQNK